MLVTGQGFDFYFLYNHHHYCYSQITRTVRTTICRSYTIGKIRIVVKIFHRNSNIFNSLKEE